MKNLQSDNFNLWETNLSGNKTGGTISSYHFIMESGRILLDYSKTRPTELPALLHEYSAILKLLVKKEMLAEMKSRIDNIDTFYN